MEKFILLGASRGLGWQTYLQLRTKKPESRFLLSSRKIGVRVADVDLANTLILEQDFSRAPVAQDYLQKLQEFAPTTLIYFAGGGPYGIYQSKKWSDHQWALQTSFLYPAELLHRILQGPENWPQLKQIVLIGSAIAESKPDPQAASYAAAKHALRGLVDSVNIEQKCRIPVLLFSPGYMQTDLLPVHSEPRLRDKAENPEVVAGRLIEYIENNFLTDGFMSDQKVENVIIIGSGPAGLTAAVYSSRARLEPLMIEGEEAGGQLMITTEVENYPGFEHGITGPDLIAVMRKQAERFGTRFITRNVTKVDFSARPFKVYVGHDLHLAKTVIISTGASAKLLGLPSEKQYMSRGVSACATCDGAFFRNMEVGVVGGGDTAMEEANFLTRFASKVYILHRSENFRASKIMLDRAKKNQKIEFVHHVTVEEVLGDGKSVNAVKLRDTRTNEINEKKLQGLFIAIGHQPNTKLFKDILDMNEAGYLVTKPGSTYTNIEGVFASGDVQDPIYRQAITAAGSGCMASIDSERWLEANEEAH